jgi:hypothetical protein
MKRHLREGQYEHPILTENEIRDYPIVTEDGLSVECLDIPGAKGWAPADGSDGKFYDVFFVYVGGNNWCYVSHELSKVNGDDEKITGETWEDNEKEDGEETDEDKWFNTR